MQCKTCKADFDPMYAWTTECYPCFIASPRGKVWKKRKEAERSAFHANERDESFSKGWRDYRADPPDEAPKASGGRSTIDKDLLRKLIMLCHPDKHGGSEMSNSVTKILLEMKGKQ